MAAQNGHLTKAGHYAFQIKGLFRSDWSDWLEGLEITPLENGDTLLSGFLPDQAALHGVLAKIRDLNLILISVNQTDSRVMMNKQFNSSDENLTNSM